MKHKHMKSKIGTLGLAAVLIPAALAVPASAAESASVDETLYVNMDYAGAIDKASVVKHIFFGTDESYTDHGDYISLTDMSTGGELDYRGNTLTIPAQDDGSFYFEGELDPTTVTLPWEFTVSYSLNGVKTDPANIGGASGLVEIDIDAYPDPSASAYMRDNFILMAAIPLDLSNYYSVDAPGSQRAALGDMSAVVFEALPGAEAHFTARLGSDSFETVGIILVMSPASVSDLSHIKDLKRLDDTFRSDLDKMLSGLGDLMDQVSGMSEELSKTALALDNLKEGKSILHAHSDAIFDGNAAAIEDVRILADKLTPLNGSLKTMEWLVYDLNRELNALDQDLLSLSSRMSTLSARLKSLGSGLAGMDSISEAELNTELNEIMDELKAIANALISSSFDTEELTDAISTLNTLITAFSGSPYEDALISLKEALENLLISLNAIESGIEGLTAPEGISDLNHLMGSLSSDIEEVSGYAGSVSFQTARVLNSLENLTGDLDSLVAVLNNYYDDIEGTLASGDDALGCIETASVDTARALDLINETLRAASASFSDAADLGIEAGEEAVDNSLGMIDSVGDLRDSGGDLKTTVDEELDRLENESRLLSMDPDAPRVSLTSSQNPEPASVTIICRTEEIRAGDEEVRAILDAEAAEAESTAWGRIKAVFTRMWQFIKDIFDRA